MYSKLLKNIFTKGAKRRLGITKGAKRSLSIFLTFLILLYNISFTFFLTQTILFTMVSNKAFAYNEIVAPENIIGKPIDHIVVDPNSGNTSLDRSQNGTPVVNINTPSAGGVSVNRYQDFNVNQENLIFNNYKGEAANSQIGGSLYGNPNFNLPNAKEADVILNEVTTNRISKIEGYVEVFGKKADLIIANPNGIMVNGAGFINTNRLSMITGSSGNGNPNNTLDAQGKLNPFLISKDPNALITVTGRNITDNQGNTIAYNLGIDATDINYVDLISRVVKINGDIYGNTTISEDKPFTTEVNIKTGNDKAYYNTDKNGNKNNNGFNITSKTNANNAQGTNVKNTNNINNTNNTDNKNNTQEQQEDEQTTKPEFAIDSTALGGIYAGRINFIATEEGLAVRSRSDLVATTDDINFDVNGNIILEEEGSLYAKRNINLNNKTSIEHQNKNQNINLNNEINNSNNTDNNKELNPPADFVSLSPYEGGQGESQSNNSNHQIINKSTIVAENNVNILSDKLINTSKNINKEEETNIEGTSAESANIEEVNADSSNTNNSDINDKSNTKDSNTQTSLIYALNSININSNYLDNSNTKDNGFNSGIITGLGDINLNVKNEVENTKGLISSGANLNIFSLNDNNETNKINEANKFNETKTNEANEANKIINNIKFNNIDGELIAGHNLIAMTDNLNNTNSGYIFANNMNLYNLDNTSGIVEGNYNIFINEKLNNEKGSITSLKNDSNIILNINDGTIDINKDGKIKGNGNIIANILSDYLMNGEIYSNQTLEINANNIYNITDKITSNNIIINSNGNIYNGNNENSSAKITALNDLVFNILNVEERNGGSLYNYGILSANNNLLISAADSVYNGVLDDSSAKINAKNNIMITAGNSIINKGFLQATGNGNSGSGNLILLTKAELNSDYELGDNNINLDDVNKDNSLAEFDKLSPEAQDIYDRLDTITDVNALYELIPLLKTEEQYYNVQKMIRVLNIKNTLGSLEEAYTFNSEDWNAEEILKYIKENENEDIVEEDNSNDSYNNYEDFESHEVDNEGNELGNYFDEADGIIHNLLQETLGSNYKEEDWALEIPEDKLNEINTKYSEQQERYAKYNEAEKQKSLDKYEEQKEQAKEDFIKNGGKEEDFTYQEFVYNDISMEDYVLANSDIETEGVINRNELTGSLRQEAESLRLKKIEDYFNSKKQLVDKALNEVNWEELTDAQIQGNLQIILGNDYNKNQWSIEEYQDRDIAGSITQEYIGSLRIDKINKSAVEKTGIHNYGRIYSKNNMQLNSNSVLHNNKKGLIFSNNDIYFNINKVLFNNENAMGLGIFANNNITINGLEEVNGNFSTVNPVNSEKYSLEKLINYNGNIEANNNIDIKAKDVINYGSDSIDLTKIDNEIKSRYDYYIYEPAYCSSVYCAVLNKKVARKRKVSKEVYEQAVADGKRTDKVFKYYYVEEYPELKKAYNLKFKWLRNPGLYETVHNGYYEAFSDVVSDKSTIKSNNGNLNIEANNTTNYNSTLFAGKDINIDTVNLLNKNFVLNVNSKNVYQYKGKRCKWHGGSCKTYIDQWTSPIVVTIQNGSSAKISAKGNLSISAKSVGNGTVEDHSNYIPDATRLAYAPDILPETNAEIISRTGTINPLDNTILPEGNYGIFRKSENPDNKFIFETDPDLLDLTKFLGTDYFMNRIGLDPDSVDLKFLGDSYYEHELIRGTLEQYFGNNGILRDNPDQTIDDKINNLYANVDKDLQESLGLVFGEPLTEEQLANLDKDIVWYVKQDITLPDGTIVKDVLVPQVYLSQENRNKLTESLDTLKETGSMIAANNITIIPNNTLDNAFDSVINNAGSIMADNQLVIAADTINNITTTIDRHGGDNADQATITAGNTLVINTGANGILNNLSGDISTTNDNSLLYVNTGTLNNITTFQQESVEHTAKDHEFNKVETLIGGTSTIQAKGDNSNIIINANQDINMLGADILAEQDNSNIILNAGNNINISTLQDYEYERQYTNRKGKAFAETLVKENIDQSVTNIQSNISTGGTLSITTGNDLNSIGTNFTANNGDINLDIGNNLNLFNATDFVYDYDYTYRERFDLAGALTKITTAMATAAITLNPAAVAAAGISAASSSIGMTKGSLDVEMNYDETIVGNTLSANNINITTGNDFNSVSTVVHNNNTGISNDRTVTPIGGGEPIKLNNSPYIKVEGDLDLINHSTLREEIDNININETLSNTEQNSFANVNLNIKGNTNISQAEEKHEHDETHNTWGGDLGRAALSGVITGATAAAGVKGGDYLTNITGSALQSTLRTTLIDAVNKGISSAIVSYTSIIGNSMSSVVLNGGDFKDVLKAGRDSATDKDTFKSTMISGLSSGITAGLTEKLNLTNTDAFTDKLKQSAISNTTSTALQSAINGDSFMDGLKSQLVDTLVMAGASYTANQIGEQYHSNNLNFGIDGTTGTVINKTTQLLLHAGLGAATNALTGNDALSGAVAGVTGEVFAELLKNTMYSDIDIDKLTDKQKNDIAGLSGLASGISSLIVGKVQDLDVNDIRDNVYSGYRVGQNAAKNNYLMPKEKSEYKKELENCGNDINCKKEVYDKYEKISEPRDEKINKLLLYGDPDDFKELHYDLRMELTEEGNEYYLSLSDKRREEEFIKLPDSASIYHTFQQDENGNVINVITGSEQGYTKYVHPVYGYEIVLDDKKNIVTDPINAGTYNFYNPKLDDVESDPLINGNTKHFFYDVIPYYKFGNSDNDPSIGSDRIIRGFNIPYNNFINHFKK